MCYTCKAQTVYFYTTNTNLLVNVGVNISYQGKRLTRIKENSWFRCNLGGIQQANFKFKSGTYLEIPIMLPLSVQLKLTQSFLFSKRASSFLVKV